MAPSPTPDGEFGACDWTAFSVYRGSPAGTLPSYDGEPTDCAPDAGVFSVGLPEPIFWFFTPPAGGFRDVGEPEGLDAIGYLAAQPVAQLGRAA